MVCKRIFIQFLLGSLSCLHIHWLLHASRFEGLCINLNLSNDNVFHPPLGFRHSTCVKNNNTNLLALTSTCSMKWNLPSAKRLAGAWTTFISISSFAVSKCGFVHIEKLCMIIESAFHIVFWRRLLWIHCGQLRKLIEIHDWSYRSYRYVMQVILLFLKFVFLLHIVIPWSSDHVWCN